MVDSKSSSLLSTDIAIVSPMCTKESVGRCVEASLLTEIPSLLQLAEDRVDAVLKLRQSLGVCESNLDIFNNAWPSLAHSHKAMTQFIVRASCANTSSLISSNSEMLRTRTLSDLDALRIKIKSDLLHLQNMLYIEIQEMASDEHQLIELKVKIKNDLYR